MKQRAIILAISIWKSFALNIFRHPPFDKEFYIVINTAIGGWYFPDGCNNLSGQNKPYANSQSQSLAQRSFWWGGVNAEYNDNRESVATWNGDDVGFQIKNIKVFEYQLDQ